MPKQVILRIPFLIRIRESPVRLRLVREDGGERIERHGNVAVGQQRGDPGSQRRVVRRAQRAELLNAQRMSWFVSLKIRGLLISARPVSLSLGTRTVQGSGWRER